MVATNTEFQDARLAKIEALPDEECSADMRGALSSFQACYMQQWCPALLPAVFLVGRACCVEVLGTPRPLKLQTPWKEREQRAPADPTTGLVDAVRWGREVSAFFQGQGSEPQPGAAPAEARAELQQLLKVPLAYVCSPEGFASFAPSAGWFQVSPATLRSWVGGGWLGPSMGDRLHLLCRPPQTSDSASCGCKRCCARSWWNFNCLTGLVTVAPPSHGPPPQALRPFIEVAPSRLALVSEGAWADTFGWRLGDMLRTAAAGWHLLSASRMS